MPSILIVEKNEFLRKSLREAVEAQFPNCCFDDTGDGRVALQKAHAGTPDLVLVSMRLDGINGLEFTSRLKDAHPEAVVCLLPDADLPEYRTSARECGADLCVAMDSLTGGRLYSIIATVLRKAAKRGRTAAGRQRFPVKKPPKSSASAR